MKAHRTSGAQRRGAKVLLGVIAASTVAVVWAPQASAHPLGNFTTNTAVAVQLGGDAVTITYAVDTAEIPTLRAKGEIDGDGDGAFSRGELSAYGDTMCASVAKRLTVAVDGAAVALDATLADAALAEGAAGLQTLRVGCELTGAADLSSGGHDVTIDNGWVGDRIGWHEITAVGDGITLDTSAPAESPSDGLRAYPEDQLSSPPDVRTATIATTPGGPAADIAGAAGAAGTDGSDGSDGADDEGRRVSVGQISAIPAVDGASASFTDLVSKEQLTFGVALLGLFLAILLGSLHALAPGHGKTVMAAYLLGGEGSGRQALALCATVTITHTAGVLVLGTVLTVTTVVAPERLYPVLGAISGLLVASIGVSMLRRARKNRTTGVFGAAGHHHPHVGHQHGAHDHDHEMVPAKALVAAGGVADTNHSHDAHSHDAHAHDAHSHDAPDHHHHGGGGHVHPHPGEPVSWRSLVGMGFAGGMVPSPSALLVLLGAIALGRTWFGVVLVIAYGLGMAVSLVAAGLLLLRLRNRLDRYLATRRGAKMSERLVVLPALTALLVIGGGVYIALRAALQF